MNFAIAKVTSLSDTSSDELNSSTSSSGSSSSSCCDSNCSCSSSSSDSSSDSESNSSSSSSGSSSSSCCDSNCSCSSSSSDSSSDSESKSSSSTSGSSSSSCCDSNCSCSSSSSESSSDTEEEESTEAVQLNEEQKFNVPKKEVSAEESKCTSNHAMIEEKSEKTIAIHQWLRKCRDENRKKVESQRIEIQQEKLKLQAVRGYQRFQRESKTEDKKQKPEYTQPILRQEIFKPRKINNQENLSARNEKKSEKPITKVDLQKIILSRDTIERLLHNKNFDKIVHGCYVRVSMRINGGQRYVLSQVIGIRRLPNAYVLGNSTTNKALLLRAGNTVLSLNFVSNQEITDGEFTIWKRESANNNNIPVPTLDGIANKVKEMKEGMSSNLKKPVEKEEGLRKVTTAAEKGPAIYNKAKRKIELRFQRDEASWRGDFQLAKKLNSQILELDEDSVKSAEPERKRFKLASNTNGNDDSNYGNQFQRKFTRPRVISGKRI